jgi:hypothetical protein
VDPLAKQSIKEGRVLRFGANICGVPVVRQSELYGTAPCLAGSANPALDGAQLG